MTSPRRQPLRIAALFAGPVDDGGFMQSGHAALMRAAAENGARVRVLERVPAVFDAMREGIDRLAADGADLVIAHGGQNNEAALDAAARHPATLFAVTQGQVATPNVASYDVMQEHSAFLAGMLAALTTRTGVVAHLSGIRVRPGLKGRAAFAAGVAHANPDVGFLTCFCGHQDDHAAADAAARDLIAAGADRIFTMLNSGRSGAVSACRDLGCAQIGNVDDWTLREPDVFIGSAMADVGWGVARAVRDAADGAFPAGAMRHVGLEEPAAVRLAVRPDVAASVLARIQTAADAIASGALIPPQEWTGDEMAP